MHSLAMRIYSLYNMKHPWSTLYFEPSLSIRDKILTSITGGMDSESLYQASLSIQPISPRNMPDESLRKPSKNSIISSQVCEDN